MGGFDGGGFRKKSLDGAKAFIPAPLPTAIFPQRFSFFTVYLVQWLRGLTPWWKPKGSLFTLKHLGLSVDCCKMHFLRFFFLFEF